MLLEEDIENFLEDERRAAEGVVETSIEDEGRHSVAKKKGKTFSTSIQVLLVFQWPLLEAIGQQVRNRTMRLQKSL
jgi:hypothetical protein